MRFARAGFRRRRLLSGALALLVLVVSAAVSGGPAALPTPHLRLASTTNPAPPTGVVPTGADRALTLSWSAPGEAFISGYRVFLDGGLVAGPTGTLGSPFRGIAAPVISADGRSIVLGTAAPRVPADTNGLVDVYRLDTATSAWSLVSAPAAGAVLRTGSSVYATNPPVALSADGDLVLFYSARSDLVAGDTNGVVDVFARRISTGGNLAGAATGPARRSPRTAGSRCSRPPRRALRCSSTARLCPARAPAT